MKPNRTWFVFCAPVLLGPTPAPLTLCSKQIGPEWLPTFLPTLTVSACCGSGSSGRSRSSPTTASLQLGGPRQRSTLALLLLNANRVVSIDQLADALYAGRPPVTAVTQVHRQVSELRKGARLGGDPHAGLGIRDQRTAGSTRPLPLRGACRRMGPKRCHGLTPPAPPRS